MKTQINFRASPATAAELAQLVALLGEGQTEVISRAIATLHHKRHDHLHFEIANAEAGTCPWCGWQYEDPEFPNTSPTWGGRRTPAGGRPTMTPEQKARERVARSPKLQQYEATIFYDWPNWDEHMQWIATAPVKEIVDWAEQVSAPLS